MKVTALEITCLRHKVDYYFQDLWPLEHLIQRLNFSVFFLPYFPTFEKLPVFSDLAFTGSFTNLHTQHGIFAYIHK